MQQSLIEENPLLNEGNTEVKLVAINNLLPLESCTPGARRRPGVCHPHQHSDITLLDFKSVVALDFGQDQDAIQDAFTDAVIATYTIENVAKTLQTPELEEKYGEFEVIGAETDGTRSTLVSVTRFLSHS